MVMEAVYPSWLILAVLKWPWKSQNMISRDQISAENSIRGWRKYLGLTHLKSDQMTTHQNLFLGGVS